jgi:hypothetical protein
MLLARLVYRLDSGCTLHLVVCRLPLDLCVGELERGDTHPELERGDTHPVPEVEPERGGARGPSHGGSNAIQIERGAPIPAKEELDRGDTDQAHR